MTLIDYILLYKYKDELLATLSEKTNFGLEELYEPNTADRSTQVAVRPGKSQPKQRPRWKLWLIDTSFLAR